MGILHPARRSSLLSRAHRRATPLDGGRLDEWEVRDFRAIVDATAGSVLYERALLDLSGYLRRHHGERVVVLVDEYDQLPSYRRLTPVATPERPPRSPLRNHSTPAWRYTPRLKGALPASSADAMAASSPGSTTSAAHRACSTATLSPLRFGSTRFPRRGRFDQGRQARFFEAALHPVHRIHRRARWPSTTLVDLRAHRAPGEQAPRPGSRVDDEQQRSHLRGALVAPRVHLPAGDRGAARGRGLW